MHSLTVASSVGRIGRRVEHDRADRRRARDCRATHRRRYERAARRPACRLVVARERAGSPGVTGRGSRRSCRSTRLRRPPPRRIARPRSTGSTGGRPGTSCRRAAPRPRPCSARGGARSRRAATRRRRRPAVARAASSAAISASISASAVAMTPAQPFDLGARAWPTSASRAASSRVERLALLPSPRALGLRGRSADAAACRCRPASPAAPAAT